MIQPEIVKQTLEKRNSRPTSPITEHCIKKWNGWIFSFDIFDEKSVYWKIVSYVQ